MPDIAFTITGTNSAQFVADWAKILGYKTQIRDPENEGVFIDNPQSNVDYIVEAIFRDAKVLVEEYRVANQISSVRTTVKTDLDEITLG